MRRFSWPSPNISSKKITFTLKGLRQAFTAERLFGAESKLASIFGGGSRVDDRVAEAKAKQELAVEDKLAKLEYLYEEGLITEEVYKARQISILESYK